MFLVGFGMVFGDYMVGFQMFHICSSGLLFFLFPCFLMFHVIPVVLGGVLKLSEVLSLVTEYDRVIFMCGFPSPRILSNMTVLATSSPSGRRKETQKSATTYILLIMLF